MADIAAPERRPRKRIAKGPPRPAYLNEKDLDRVTIMLVAVVSELLTARDQIANMRELLEREGLVDRASFEGFRPDAASQSVREADRSALLRRVFRVLHDEFEHYHDPEA